MKKVVVLGVTGFIGRNMAERLAGDERYEVYGTYYRSEPFVHPRIKMMRADLTNKGSVDKAVRGMDVVIQAAAVTSGAKDILTKPFIHVTDNAVMNAYIFRSAYEHKVKHVVFFSCTIFYRPGPAPIKETDFDVNQEMPSSYFGAGWTKLYHEKMCEFYSRIGPTKYTVIRHSNIYGPHDKFDLEHSHVFGASMTKVMTAPEGGNVTVWGSGEEGRDLLYVDDLVDFVARAIAAQKAKFELMNVGCGRFLKVKDLVHKIIRHSGKKLNVHYDPSKPTIPTTIYLDTVRALDVFGWSPKVCIDEGIQKTMRWYQHNVQTGSVLAQGN